MENLVNEVLRRKGCLVKVDVTKRAQQVMERQSKDELSILIKKLMEEDCDTYKDGVREVKRN